MIKKLWNGFYNYAFCDAPVKEVAQTDLDKSIRELLVAMDAVDYADAMVQYRGKQIARYTNYIDNPNAFIRKACGSECGDADAVQFSGITLLS